MFSLVLHGPSVHALRTQRYSKIKYICLLPHIKSTQIHCKSKSSAEFMSFQNRQVIPLTKQKPAYITLQPAAAAASAGRFSRGRAVSEEAYMNLGLIWSREASLAHWDWWTGKQAGRKDWVISCGMASDFPAQNIPSTCYLLQRHTIHT